MAEETANTQKSTVALPSIDEVLGGLSDFLNEKNRRYGNSASNPLRIFSKVDRDSGVLVRMDDKLSRIASSSKIRKNDIVDLTGYLILYMRNNGWADFSDLID